MAVGSSKGLSRLREIWPSDPNRKVVSEILTTTIVVGGVLMAGAAAMLMVAYANDLAGSSSGIADAASSPYAGQFAIIDAMLLDREECIVLQELIRLPPGADPLDLREMALRVRAGTATTNHSYAPSDVGRNDGACPPSGHFTATVLRDQQQPFNASRPILEVGDLVQLQVGLDATLQIERGDSIFQQQAWNGQNRVENEFLATKPLSSDRLVPLRVIVVPG